MKKANHTTKNVVPQEVETKKTFSEFMSNFNTLKKADAQFFLWDDRRVDYIVLKSAAKSKGIKDIPTEEELTKLI